MEEERVVASTCSFPSRLELAPGVYRVRARWKGLERFVDEVAVEGGASTVRVVSFGADEQLTGRTGGREERCGIARVWSSCSGRTSA